MAVAGAERTEYVYRFLDSLAPLKQKGRAIYLALPFFFVRHQIEYQLRWEHRIQSAVGFRLTFLKQKTKSKPRPLNYSCFPESYPSHFHKIIFPSIGQRLRGQFRRNTVIVGTVDDLINKIAGMAGV